jgi:hypothetical protein
MSWGYREDGRGVVAMTNGDNGAQLAQELLAAIAATYGWPDFKPVEKAVVAVPAGDLLRLRESTTHRTIL